MFTSLLNKEISILERVRTKNAIGEAVESLVPKGVAKGRYEKLGREKVIREGYTLTTNDYIFYFDKDVDVALSDYLEVDGQKFEILEVELIYGKSAPHHKEVFARAYER